MGENKVLLVGHCGFDSGRIVCALEKAGFDQIVSAGTINEAVGKLADNKFSLVVANRVIAGNEDGGVNLVRKINSDENTASVPVMVLSAFNEVQKSSIKEGAVPGFSKDFLESDVAVKEFSKYIK